MSRIVGFDPSMTNFGWVVLDEGHTKEPSLVARGRFQTKSKQLFIARYTYLRDQVIELLAEYDPDNVSCESPIFNDLYSEGMYALFMYVNEAVWKAEKDIVFFSPGQLKKLAKTVLKRPKVWKMEKEDMVQAAKRLLNVRKNINHNEADAVWAGRAGARFFALINELIDEGDLIAAERDMFIKTHTFIRGKRAGQTVRSGLVFKENKRYFRFSQGDFNIPTITGSTSG
jgi:Holliday junction resolvasome RuvABC endonuclease subunit